MGRIKISCTDTTSQVAAVPDHFQLGHQNDLTNTLHGDGFFPLKGVSTVDTQVRSNRDLNGEVVPDTGKTVKIRSYAAMIDGVLLTDKSKNKLDFSTFTLLTITGSGTVHIVAEPREEVSSDGEKHKQHDVAVFSETTSAPAVDSGKILVATLTGVPGTGTITAGMISNAVKDYLEDVDNLADRIEFQLVAPLESEISDNASDIAALTARIVVLEQLASSSGIVTQSKSLTMGFDANGDFDLVGSSNVEFIASQAQLTSAGSAGTIVLKQSFGGEGDTVVPTPVVVTAPGFIISNEVRQPAFSDFQIRIGTPGFPGPSLTTFPQLDPNDAIMTLLEKNFKLAGSGQVKIVKFPIETTAGAQTGEIALRQFQNTVVLRSVGFFGGAEFRSETIAFNWAPLAGKNITWRLKRTPTTNTWELVDADDATVYLSFSRPNGVIYTGTVNHFRIRVFNNTSSQVVTDDYKIVSGFALAFNTPGVLLSKGLPSTDPLKTIKFLANATTPTGTTLTVEIAPDGTSFSAITLNELRDLTPAQVSPSLKFRFTLIATDTTKTPLLSSVAYATDNSVAQADFLAAKAKINAIIAAVDQTAQNALDPL